MGIGNFRTQAIFRTRSPGTNSYGEPLDIYSDLLTMGARVTQLSGNERQIFTQGVAETSDFISIVCRYRQALDNIDKTAQVVLEGRVYDIVGIDRMDERKQYLRFVLRGDR